MLTQENNNNSNNKTTTTTLGAYEGEKRHIRIKMGTALTVGVTSAQQVRDTTTETWFTYGNSTWHAGKYRVLKLHQVTFWGLGTQQSGTS